MATRARATRRSTRSPLAPFRPQLAKLVDRAPEGDAWLHEMKYDGYRIGCTIERGRVKLESRSGQDWTRAFPEVVAAVAQLPVKQLQLDGEVAIVTKDGRTSFQALQNAFKGGARHGLSYLVFDLLHLEGEDLTQTPLEARKKRLQTLLASAPRGRVLRYADHVIGHGPRVLARACELGAEGIVSKRRDAPYCPGRTSAWLKAKCFLRQEFVVGGFTDPEGTRSGLGSLLLGYHDTEGRLRFAGKVGTGPGLTARHWTSLRHELEEIEQRACPFDPRPAGFVGKHAHWVEPVRVAEVTFTEWTEAGQVRHPSLQGFRADKPARGVLRETATKPPGESEHGRGSVSKRGTKRAPRSTRAESIEVAGVTITSPDRPVYPALGVTKRDVAEYTSRVAELMLQHVADRPLTLVRCERGVTERDALRSECTFLRHTAGYHRWASAAIRRVQIPEQKKVGEYLVVDTREALVAITQGDILEIHCWNSTTNALETPDRFVFDLDPAEDVAWPDVINAARRLRTQLSRIGLEGWPKLTGGKGLHVVAPFVPELDWDASYRVARLVGESLVKTDPATFTLDFGKARRAGKILVDVKRNHRAAVAVAPYSLRAHPRGTVALPVSWDELSPDVPPDHYTVQNVLAHITRRRKDAWHGYEASRRRIGSAPSRRSRGPLRSGGRLLPP